MIVPTVYRCLVKAWQLLYSIEFRFIYRFVVGIFLVHVPSFLILSLSLAYYEFASYEPMRDRANRQIDRLRIQIYYGIGHLAIHNLPMRRSTI